MGRYPTEAAIRAPNHCTAAQLPDLALSSISPQSETKKASRLGLVRQHSLGHDDLFLPSALEGPKGTNVVSVGGGGGSWTGGQTSKYCINVYTNFFVREHPLSTYVLRGGRGFKEMGNFMYDSTDRLR